MARFARLSKSPHDRWFLATATNDHHKWPLWLGRVDQAGMDGVGGEDLPSSRVLLKVRDLPLRKWLSVYEIVPTISC